MSLKTLEILPRTRRLMKQVHGAPAGSDERKHLRKAMAAEFIRETDEATKRSLEEIRQAAARERSDG